MLATKRCSLAFAVLLALVVLAPTSASAGPSRHKVRAGQTLGEIALRHGCPIASLRRANRLRGDLIQPGQVLSVPRCAKRTSSRAARAETTALVRRPQPVRPRRTAATTAAASQSIGKPWRGRLRGAVRLPAGKGYVIRRPLRAWGTPELIAGVRGVIARVHADHREHHALAIGDLSGRIGGPLSEHRSHQSGRDIDVGFFYREVPSGYPRSFVVATADNLDRAATWDLLVAFARTAGDADGVEVIFLDYEVQGLLHDWARDNGVNERMLDRLFQYPDGKEGTGLVRHEPHHADHFHVRFRCSSKDAACE